MRKLLLLTLLFACLTFGESYDVHPDPASRLALLVYKTGLMRGKHHLFLFERYRGRLDFDAAHPEASRIELTMESASASCKDDWVSASDLKKIQQTALEDMLAAKSYPTMTFRSSAVRALGGNQFEARGILTLRGTEKPAVVMVQLDASNTAQLKLAGSATIRLSDYKLKPPSALLGAIGTKDEMNLEFTIIATK